MAFRSLVSAIFEQCQEIRQTLSSISYFNTWDASTIAECCRLSSLAEFSPEEIILGSGTGNSHTVYFILDGVCKMIHYLQVETKTDSWGETKYSLYKSVDQTLDSESASVGYVSLLFNEKHEFQREKIVEKPVGNEEVDPREKTKPKDELQDAYRVTELTRPGVAGNGPLQTETNMKGTDKSNYEETEKRDVLYDMDHHLRVLQECRKKLQDIIRVNMKETAHEKPKNVNGYFIQMGFLFKGACFGLKKITNRDFIMAETKVKCLKIPQRFLLQHNHCNIWNRILLFDSLYQPKEQNIFESFQTDRKWLEGKKKLTEDIISKKKIPNYTGISDVPYSIRLTKAR